MKGCWANYSKPTCPRPKAWHARRHGRLAQLVEHLVYTERVGGSSPSPPTTTRDCTAPASVSYGGRGRAAVAEMADVASGRTGLVRWPVLTLAAALFVPISAGFGEELGGSAGMGQGARGLPGQSRAPGAWERDARRGDCRRLCRVGVRDVRAETSAGPDQLHADRACHPAAPWRSGEPDDRGLAAAVVATADRRWRCPRETRRDDHG